MTPSLPRKCSTTELRGHAVPQTGRPTSSREIEVEGLEGADAPSPNLKYSFLHELLMPGAGDGTRTRDQ